MGATDSTDSMQHRHKIRDAPQEHSYRCTQVWLLIARAIITDPLYKALNTLAEKKAVWQKVYIYMLL
jgi:hypothetical protein